MTTEIGPVNIKMTSSGITEVIDAFQNVEARVVALDRKLDQISQSGARKRVKTAKDEATAKNKETDKEVANTEKAEQEKTKAADKWAKAREKIIHNSAMMAGRLAKQQANMEIKEAERSAHARIRFSQQLAGRIVSDFRSTLGHATRIFGALTALGGGLSVGNAFSNEMKVSKSAMALEIASDVPGKPEQKINAATATANARRMGIEYGVSTSDVLETQHAIIAKTGKGKESGALTEAAMKIATAEGADPKELGQAVANAMAQNPKLTVTEGINLMKMMVDQGKVGAIEIKDMAKILPVLTKTSALYGGKQSDAQARLTTMVQTAIQTTGGPEQAAVAVSRFSESMASKKGAKAMKAAGFDVFDKGGQLKPVDQLMEDYLKAGGGSAKGSAALGILDGRAKSLALAFQGTYQASLKEGKTKEEAAKDALKNYREELTMRATDAKIDSDLKKVQSTDAFKVSQNMQKLEQAIALKLVPALIPAIEKLGKLAPEIGKVLESIGRFINWAITNPWQAVGLAVAGALAKAVFIEVAASGLRKILGSAFAPGGGGAPGVGAGGAKTAAAGAAAMIGIGGGVQGVDIMLSGEPGLRADETVRQSLKGNKEAQAKIKEVMEEGTGIGGDLKRFGKGVLATAAMGVGSQSGREWYEEIGTRSHIAAQLSDEDTKTQITKKMNEENTDATKKNTDAMNQLSNKIENLQVGSGFGGGAPSTPKRDAGGNIIPDKKSSTW